MDAVLSNLIPSLPRVLRGLIVACLGLTATGCVERVIRVTSQPTGALVYLNDEEVGRTPLTVPFTFYGTYDVRLECDGYQPLWIQQETVAPWWEAPGPDLFAEAVPGTHVQLDWHFEMKSALPVDEERLIERADIARDWITDADGSTSDNPLDAEP